MPMDAQKAIASANWMRRLRFLWVIVAALLGAHVQTSTRPFRTHVS